MKKTIIILVAIILLILVGFFIFKSKIPTGSTIQEIPEKYTYTKAICDKNNLCQDYEITCEGNILTNQKPLTGAVIQHEENWKDPRTKEQIEKLC